MWLNVIRRLSVSVKACATENLIKIDLVPPRLHNHLFGENESNECNPLVASCSGENSSDSVKEAVNRIELPKLRVFGNLMEHFEELAKEQFFCYEQLLEIAEKLLNVPKMPKDWVLQTGWTSYDPITGETHSVEFPDEKLLFFDVEVCVQDGQLPTIAVALSPTKWYSWCSDRIVNLSEVSTLSRLEHLIPLESSKDLSSEKIIIGHNIAYDRSRVREQYLLKKTKTRFWDTMSMSIAVCGMADHQRLMFERSDSATVSEEEWLKEWRLRVCKNSLEAVHAKFCGDSSRALLKKEFQDVFVKENIETIRENFQTLTNYCANDVLATLEVYQALYPQFKERFPSKVTYCGMLEMASAYLPITSNWRVFYDKCERTAAEKRDNAARNVVESARLLVKEMGDEKKREKNVFSFESDPWLWVSDWRMLRTSAIPAWFQNFFKLKMFSDDNMADDLVAENLRLLNRDVPRVFGLCYGPYPLFFKHDYGWGFLVPNEDVINTNNWSECQTVRLKKGNEVILPNRKILDLIQQNQTNGVNEVHIWSKPLAKVGIFDYYRLPHPSGLPENVGTPFSKDYREYFEQKLLWSSRFADVLGDFLDSRSVTRFWGNYRERFHEQLAIWLDDNAKIGAIAPSIIPSGTVTRRAVHKLWLVSTNAKKEMIGSDLKSMVQCSDGWSLVGADVDSQEQWIAASFGDSAYSAKRAGATAFSNMLLAGDKSNGTDLHSVVAREAKITRDHAKVLNYARLYGSGKAHAVEFLKQHGVADQIALKISDKLFNTTKGSTIICHELNPDLKEDYEHFLKYVCRPEYVARQSILVNDRHFLPVYCKLSGELSRIFEKWILSRIRTDDNCKELSARIKVPDDLYAYVYRNFPQQIPLFRGGFESYTFNYLELMSREPVLKTPILGCRLSRALEPLSNPNSPAGFSFFIKYKRSVINWFVQSSAVDFLHMLLVCMTWLCEEYDIDARFVISIHDEIRYLVKDEDRHRCALALLLSNMYTRSAISSKLGLNELPMSIAFFTKVDVDKVLRKEVDIPIHTPIGEIIPPGEGLSIKEIIELTDGSLRRKSLKLSKENCIEDNKQIEENEKRAIAM